MPAKKKSVTTPLHLLQQLSHSLIEHLDKACTQAIADAENALAKLQKERGRAQDKLTKARAKLDEAGNAGKAKAQTKVRTRLTELEDSLALLQNRQSETLAYLADLKRDAEQSLKLSQGIRQVADAAEKQLNRQQPNVTTPSASAPRQAPRKPTSKSAPAAAKTTAASATPKATKAPVKPAAKAPAKPQAKTPASTAASKPAAASPAKGKAPARSRPSSAVKANVAAPAEGAMSAADAPAKPAAAKPAAKAAPKKPAARKPSSGAAQKASVSN